MHAGFVGREIGDHRELAVEDARVPSISSCTMRRTCETPTRLRERRTSGDSS